MGNPAPSSVDWGAIGLYAIGAVIYILIAIACLYPLYRGYAKIPAAYRTSSPAEVWAMAFPLIGLIVAFLLMAKRIPESIERAYAACGSRIPLEERKNARQLRYIGIGFGVFGVLNYIPLLGLIFAVLLLAVYIAYVAQLHKMAALARKTLAAE